MRAEALLRGILALGLVVAAQPAAAATPRAAVELLGGGIVAGAPAEAALPEARVDGAPVTVRAVVGPFVVTDTRPAAAGWSLVVTAPPLADALGRPLGAALAVAPRPPSGGGPGIVPGSPGSIAAPRAILVAPPGSGTGRTEVAPLLSVTVPADAPTGVHTTTLVVTVS